MSVNDIAKGAAIGATGGAVLNGPMGALAGGTVGAVIGSGIFDGGPTSTVTYGKRPDYSDALSEAMANLNPVEMGQVGAFLFASKQASADRLLQTAANLELGLERVDTQLQVAKLDYFQETESEGSRHSEKMYARFAAGAESPDLPPPPEAP